MLLFSCPAYMRQLYKKPDQAKTLGITVGVWSEDFSH